MKTLLFILFICSSLSAGLDCYKIYTPAVEKVEKIYAKAQFQHSLIFKDQYIYEIYPTIMYPFFCVPADTVKRLPSYGALYLCGTTIGLHLDKDNNKHISIAVLQYIRSAGNPPSSKIYTIYFFKFNTIINDWSEERGPITVTMLLKKDGTYMSK